MADFTGWILLGGGALAAVYLYSTGAFNSLLYPIQQQSQLPFMNPPLTPQVPTPDPNSNYGLYQIPGIQSLVPTYNIVAQAPAEYLLPVPTCPFDSQLYYSPSLWASNKIWEAQYNQVAQTIAVRNQLSLMRCGMVNFYNVIPVGVDFRNPFLRHLSDSRHIIMGEFHRGTRDSDKANSAALSAAQSVHPVTTQHGHSRPSSSNGPAVGETTPPIPAHGGGSTKPVNAYYGLAYQGYGGGTVAVTGGTPLVAGNYDESKVIPCVTGNC